MDKQHIEEVLQIIEQAMLKINVYFGRQSGKTDFQYKTNRAYLAIPELLKELIAYKDAEEQGLLLRLPCKVGSDVFYILGIPNETPCVIESCTFELSDIHKIGKYLFLTKEEAEAALKKMQEGE